MITTLPAASTSELLLKQHISKPQGVTMAVYTLSASVKRHDNADMLCAQGRVTAIRPEDSRALGEGIHSSSWHARTSRRHIDSQERRS
jgi:hypothetical protein